MAFLRKRGKTWYVQYKVAGMQKRVSCRTSVKKIAQEILGKYRILETQGIHELPTKNHSNFGEFLAKHLEQSKSSLSPQWYENKRLIFEGYLLPFFGKDTLLKNLTSEKIEQYRTIRLQSISPRTVNIEVHHCLLVMLKQAVEWGELDSRYMPKVKKLREKEGRLRFLSQDEIGILLAAAGKFNGDMEAYVRLMLYAGLRSGEALHLRWKDVDWDRGNLVIAPQEQWSPKSRKGRIVPMPVGLLVYLKERIVAYPEAEYIVLGSKTYTSYRLKRLFNNVVKEAGLPLEGEDKVTAHTLRHTYASHLAMNGTPLYTVAALLGHSDTKTTQIYAHLAPDYLKEAVNGIVYKE